MPTIQVLTADNTSMGSGDGSIQDGGSRATINRWTKKAGLQQGRTYTLKSGGKTYTNMKCTNVSVNDPVAQFEAT